MKNRFFLNKRVPPVSVFNLKWRANLFKFIGFVYATLIGWILNTFQDTSIQDQVILDINKREDQA